MNPLTEIISKLEKATGPDRELDLAIYLELHPNSDVARVIKTYPRDDTRSNNEGYSWYIDGQAVIYKMILGGRCVANGGYPFPEYTKLVDAAIGLVQPRHGWLIESTTLIVLSQVYSLIEFPTPQKRFDGEHDSAAIALCIAALRARLGVKQ